MSEFNRDFKEAFGMGDVTKIARENGIDTNRKTARDLKEELMKLRQEEMKPGKEGKKGGKPGDLIKDDPIGVDPPETLLQKAVDAIKTAVESLEKKLPVPALGA